jgi:hypothetical protein
MDTALANKVQYNTTCEYGKKLCCGWCTLKRLTIDGALDGDPLAAVAADGSRGREGRRTAAGRPTGGGEAPGSVGNSR